MIAASDPQEFVPSGRQQTLRHPGPRCGPSKKISASLGEDFLHCQLEKVSIKERKESEWWVLRKTPKGASDPAPSKNDQDCVNNNPSTSTTSTDESFRLAGRKLSDPNISRVSGKFTKTESRYVAPSPYRAKADVNFTEDELYIKDHTAIWSRGLLNSSDSPDNGRKVVCSYTMPFPIKRALWCTFYCDRPNFAGQLNEARPYSESPQGTPVPSVCIVDTHNIRAFMPDGEFYVIALPFLVTNIWSTKFGILLEKQIDGFTKSFVDCKSTLYSLAYPLDEVCPVAISTGVHQPLQIFNNTNLKIIYTNENPSICMVYDSQTKQHSVYLIRKVRPSETRMFADRTDDLIMGDSQNMSTKLRNRFSMWECLKASNNPMSNTQSRPGSVTSMSANVKSHSSLFNAATVSRNHSSAGASSMGSLWLQRASRLFTSSLQPSGGGDNLGQSTCSFFDSSKAMAHLHMNPTVCFEHLWSDNVPAHDDNTSLPASKVFICDDMTGQWYLAYIRHQKFQLYIVRIEITNTTVNFGMSTSISAKDAVPIPDLHMMAILEHNGNVTLYSGLNAVGKLHVGGTLTQHTPSPYVRRTFPQFQSPFPRRSSLLPHCKQGDVRFDEHQLSPVLSETPQPSRASCVLPINFQPEQNVPKSYLSGLRDPIADKITLIYSDGSYYRVTLPPMTGSALVESCLVALRHCLPKDSVVVLLTRWYTARNSFHTNQNASARDEWNAFSALLLDLLGYTEESEFEAPASEYPVTPGANPKRKKQSHKGSDDDWLWLTTNFKLHAHSLDHIERLIGARPPPPPPQPSKCGSNRSKHTLNANSPLFQYLKIVHFALHLLYEDMKLSTLKHDDLKQLVELLSILAGDLGLNAYLLHYLVDFPEISSTLGPIKCVDCTKSLLAIPADAGDQPPSVFKLIYDLISNGRVDSPYPYVKCINSNTKNILQICGVIVKELHADVPVDKLVRTIEFGGSTTTRSGFVECKLSAGTSAEQAAFLMTERNFNVKDLDALPYGIYMLMYGALWKCREKPPAHWPPEAFYLLWREDLAKQVLRTDKDDESDRPCIYYNGSSHLQGILPNPKVVIDSDREDGMEYIDDPLLKLRFPDDVRVAEARKMLQSSRPVPIVLSQRPDVSDHDFIEEQEKHLYAICTRTLALPSGRGMFTLRTLTPLTTEPLEAPHLCVTGRAPPRGNTVDLSHIDVPVNMNVWPLFHNGAANGLRITPNAHEIDNSWILFNRPRNHPDHHTEHAGFLMALGLNGHLRNIDHLITYDYLSKANELTSIGFILGLAAARRGSCDPELTKTLSIHVEALLPPTSMEVDVAQNVQVASLLGVGMLYQATSHRHIIEVLLSEIGRPPGPEMENCVDRESYSLSAGLSLGLVMLKQGQNPLGLTDLNIPDTLHYYMVGGSRRPLTGAQKDKYKVPSFQIREGSTVNLDVTAPGATIALGLMYMASGNKAVADWMAPPETEYMLDFVRPDFLMFRILSRSLILWNEMEPTRKWVEGQVPSRIRPFCMVKPNPNMDIDYEAMNQAYCNIVTGACFALGLKFAGSADPDAFKTLMHFCRMFTKLTSKSIADLAGKPTVETCLNVLIISTSMVMAGTGCLEIMRLVRFLRRRVGVGSSAVVTYGSHMALHMALGLLFLGGGRFTLGNSPAQIAALICAFYPKFPTHSHDNRYHLQAFRHLYVLAVESRLLIPKDIFTNKNCYATLRIVKMDGGELSIKGPGTIPNLDTLLKVAIDDERYWPVVFERDRNWDTLIKLLSGNGVIHVKQRAGCLSYIADKDGYHTKLAKTLTAAEVVPWHPPASSITAFSHDQSIKYFCHHFLTSFKGDEAGAKEKKLKQAFTKCAYEAVVKDKLVTLPVCVFLIKIIDELRAGPNALNVWQLKLILAQTLATNLSTHLISTETALAVRQEVLQVLDQWNSTVPSTENLRAYLTEPDVDVIDKKKVTAFVTFYDHLQVASPPQQTPLEILSALPASKLSIHTVQKLLDIMVK